MRSIMLDGTSLADFGVIPSGPGPLLGREQGQTWADAPPPGNGKAQGHWVPEQALVHSGIPVRLFLHSLVGRHPCFIIKHVLLLTIYQREDPILVYRTIRDNPPELERSGPQRVYKGEFLPILL